MTRRRRYRWHWRAGLALVGFMAVIPLSAALQPTNYVQHALWVVAEATGLLPATPGASMGSTVAGWRSFAMPGPRLRSVVAVLAIALAFLPNLWVALAIYDRLSFARKWVHGRTYCGACGDEMRGLQVARCPSCGVAL